MSASPPKLPDLTTEPQRHPDCCLSLSTRLLSAITEVILADQDTTRPKLSDAGSSSSNNTRNGKHETILSIGSGSGLLEACLQRYMDSLHTDLESATSSRSGPATTTRLIVEGVEVHQLTSSSSLPHMQLNRYLPNHRRSTVRGTWEMSARLSLSAADMWHGEAATMDQNHDPEVGFDQVEAITTAITNDDKDVIDDHRDGDGNGARKRKNEDEDVHVHVNEVVVLMFVYPRLPALVSKYMDAISSSSSSHPTSTTSSSTSQKNKIHTIIYLGPKADWADFSPCFMRLAGSTTEFPRINILEGREAGLLEYEMMGVISFTLS